MSSSNYKYYTVQTSCSTKANAELIASQLVERKLAACVQIADNIRSVYRWNGKIEQESEFVLHIKTANKLFEQVENAIVTLHDYEVPEIIALPIIQTSVSYATWLDQNLSISS